MVHRSSLVAVAVLAAIGLAACSATSQRSQDRGYAWARTDGTIISGNPALLEQARRDIAHCQAATKATDVSMKACMLDRGYHFVALKPGDPSTNLDL